MTIQRMDHVGVVVEDLDAAKGFFAALGLEAGDEGQVEGDWADRIVGLEGIRSDLAFMKTPDGHGQVELVKFHSPPHEGDRPHEAPNAPGLRHLCFAIDDVDAAVTRLQEHGAELMGEVVRYGDIYRLCYIRGPEGIIVELAEKIS